MVGNGFYVSPLGSIITRSPVVPGLCSVVPFSIIPAGHNVVVAAGVLYRARWDDEELCCWVTVLFVGLLDRGSPLTCCVKGQV